MVLFGFATVAGVALIVFGLGEARMRLARAEAARKDHK